MRYEKPGSAGSGAEQEEVDELGVLKSGKKCDCTG